MKAEQPQRHGWTMVELLIVIAVIAILASMAVPSLSQSRKRGDDTAAVGAMRAITQAEASYRSRYTTYGSLTDLGANGMIDASLAAASTAATPRSSYYFTLAGPNGGATPPDAQGFLLLGQFVPAGGNFVFYSDESNVVYSADPSVSGFALPTTDLHGDIATLSGMGFGPVGQ